MRYFFLLFILLPLFELWLMIQVGTVIGAWPTVLLVVATAVIGLALLRHQGFSTLARGRQRMEAGEVPAEEMMEAMMLALSGVLLVAPGFATDALGFLGLISPLRRWLASRAASRMVVAGAYSGFADRRSTTVEGEFWRHDKAGGEQGSTQSGEPGAGQPPRSPGKLPDNRDP